MKTPNYTVKELYIEPYCQLPIKYDVNKIKTIILVEGEGWLQTEQYGLVEGYRTVKLLLVPMFPHLVSLGTKHGLFTKHRSCRVLEISSTEGEV